MEHRTGFTLIELMVTIGVGSILLTLAVPSFQSIIAGNRATALANEMVTALTLARSEAVKRGASVSICPAGFDDQGEVEECDENGDWEQGWIVFLDTNSNGDFDPDEEIRTWLKWQLDEDRRPSINAGGTDIIQFEALGVPDAAVTFDIHLDGCKGNQARRINIGPVGRISMTKQDCPS